MKIEDLPAEARAVADKMLADIEEWVTSGYGKPLAAQIHDHARALVRAEHQARGLSPEACERAVASVSVEPCEDGFVVTHVPQYFEVTLRVR